MAGVSTGVMLRFLAACRQARVPGRPGPNVITLGGRRMDQYAATTVNHRLAAISGMFAFRAMRDPAAVSPVPKGREASRPAAGERNGLLAHVARRPRSRSALRLRESRRLRGVVAAKGRRAAGQLRYLAGPGHRRADAVLRAAQRRGARSGRYRR
jgi:integrase/recombinase XerD